MKNIELNGKALSARELTALEIKKVLESLNSEEIHTFELMFPNEPVPALGMAMSLDIEPAALLDLTHSQMLTLLGEVKKVNPFLVEIVGTLKKLSQKIITEGDEAIEEGKRATSVSSVTSIH
ncbi:MAG: hypothetical protein Q8R88_16365 [Desulfoprunum sp.]|nr:hypothetical protein [Desulfoprunum sp.]